MRVQDMGLGLNSSLPLKERLVGIEVEVERCFTSGQTRDYWQKKHDSSLREGGAEWVTPPIPLSDAERLLTVLYDDFEGYEWASSARTGIHVHVDIRDLTSEQLQAVAVAYCLAERAFCDFVGQDREENIYCVPWYRAPREAITVMRALAALADDPARGARMLSETVKYAGLYFEPIRRFGTVEFRHAPTWTEREPVVEWTQMCYSLVEFARAQGTPDAVMSRWEQTDPVTFAFEATGYEPDRESYMAWFKEHGYGSSEGLAVQMITAITEEDLDALANGEHPEQWFEFDFDELVTLQAAGE